ATVRPVVAEHRPRLHDGVDAALVVLLRAEGGAVVEVGAAIPVAVPGVGLDGLTELLRARVTQIRPSAIRTGLRQWLERAEAGDVEPPDPDALPLPPGANEVHAVVPIARAHERQPVGAQPPTVVEGAGTVLVQRCRLVADACRAVDLLLVRV